MHYLTSGVAGAFALGLVSITAAHGQATIDDCEKIQAADAYNQCLAKFGPTSKVKSLEPEKPGDVKGSSEEAAASAKPSAFMVKKATAKKRGRAHVAARRGASRGKRSARGKASGGRKRMTFIIKRRHR